MTFLDLFAGVGGFRLGFEMAGHRCVGHCEIDRHAHRAYVAMHRPGEEEWYAPDIRSLRPADLPHADAWVFGFPCQDISAAGQQRGLHGERSGLFFTVVDLLAGKKTEDRPHWLVIENVKNLLHIRGGWDFAVVLAYLAEAGYDACWVLLNTADFGLPQHRERVFIICKFAGTVGGKPGSQVQPAGGEEPSSSSAITGAGDPVECGRVKSDDCAKTNTGVHLISVSRCRGVQLRDIANCIEESYHKGLCCNQARAAVLHADLPRAINSPDWVGKQQHGRRVKAPGEPMFTLTASEQHGILQSGRIRRLTPRECFRLQGYPDELFERAATVCSDTQLYKMAGNSVSVPVVYAIAKLLK